MKCKLCTTQTDSEAELCTVHEHALQNVKDAFTHWTRAYGTLEASDFLDRLEQLDGTGQRAKEIVKLLRDKTEILR